MHIKFIWWMRMKARNWTAARNGIPCFADLATALQSQRRLELVILATPTSAFAENFAILAQHLPIDCAITDISSATKIQLWEQAGANLPPEILNRYIPSNPQTGGTQPASYHNIPVYLCTEAANPAAYYKVEALWQSLDAHTIGIERVAIHDRLTALTSLWPHLFSFIVQNYCWQQGAHNTDLVSVELMRDIGRTMNPTDDKAADDIRLNRWQRFFQGNHAQIVELILQTATNMQIALDFPRSLPPQVENLFADAQKHSCAQRYYPSAKLNSAIYTAATVAAIVQQQLIHKNNLTAYPAADFISPSLLRLLACGIAIEPATTTIQTISDTQRFIHYLRQTGLNWQDSRFHAFDQIKMAFGYHQQMVTTPATTPHP